MDKLIAWKAYIDSVITEMAKLGIDANGFSSIDHIAYRVSSLVEYDKAKKEISDFSKLVTENMISNRPIAVFRLNKALHYKNYIIPAVELMAPKPGIAYENGIDHIEFLIPDNFDKFIRKHPSVDFDAENRVREINPTISLELNGYKVKFHHKPLLQVVELQKKTGKL